MKFLFVASVFSIFVLQFAIPSFNKYLYSGLTVDTTWEPRIPEDSPSITFCALNNKSMLGWKSARNLDGHMLGIDVHCKTPATVEDAIDCLEKETFNLTETIKPETSNFRNSFKTDNELWMHEITETYQGIACLD